MQTDLIKQTFVGAIAMLVHLYEHFREKYYFAFVTHFLSFLFENIYLIVSGTHYRAHLNQKCTANIFLFFLLFEIQLHSFSVDFCFSVRFQIHSSIGEVDLIYR